MKNLIKRLSISLVMILILSFLLPSVIPISNSFKVVEAAIVKIKEKELFLYVGDSYTLKLSGIEDKAKWTSSDETVATVTSKGKVNALSKGITIITAKINKKQYICKVTVQEVAAKVNFINDISVEYIKLDAIHRLLFSLQDINKKDLSCDASVAIKIINDKGETVYDKIHNITSKNMSIITKDLVGTRSLYTIDIPDADITMGSVKKGTIYYKVYNDGYFAFDENKLTIDNLPNNSITNSCSLKLPTPPIELSTYSYSGIILSEVVVKDIQYNFDESYYWNKSGKAVNLSIYITGEYTYGDGSDLGVINSIGYKLYKNGDMVSIGLILLSKDGDKFFKGKETIYGIEPGAYTIEILDNKHLNGGGMPIPRIIRV